MIVNLCTGCARLEKHGSRTGTGWRCEAFDGDIPRAVVTMQHDHREPYPGDGGMTYERGVAGESFELAVDAAKRYRTPARVFGVDDDNDLRELPPRSGAITRVVDVGDIVQVSQDESREMTVAEWYRENALLVDRTAATRVEGEVLDMLEAGTMQARATLAKHPAVVSSTFVRGRWMSTYRATGVFELDPDGPVRLPVAKALLVLGEDKVVFEL